MFPRGLVYLYLSASLSVSVVLCMWETQREREREKSASEQTGSDSDWLRAAAMRRRHLFSLVVLSLTHLPGGGEGNPPVSVAARLHPPNPQMNYAFHCVYV